jgi:RNA-directed DNA polymerase
VSSRRQVDVAEAMTETASGEDTRGALLVSQVVRTRVQVRMAHSLIGQVYDPRNLARAWERVRENRGASGVDRISIDRFQQDYRRYRRSCINGLGAGVIVPSRCVGWRSTSRQRPRSVRWVFSRWWIGCASRRCARFWSRFSSRRFLRSVSGFARGRSAHMAMRRIWSQVQAGGRWIVAADIADFLDA